MLLIINIWVHRGEHIAVNVKGICFENGTRKLVFLIKRVSDLVAKNLLYDFPMEDCARTDKWPYVITL